MKNDISKTEFLFESDEDKAIIKQAEKELKKKTNRKKIKRNTFLIIFFMILSAFGISFYEDLEINKIKAQIVKPAKKVPSEINKINDYNPKKVDQDYKDKYLILVNKSNPLTLDIINKYKIINVNDNLYSGISLEEETYKNYIKLKENLLDREFYINIISGYYRNNKESISEHNIGLGFDFIISSKKDSYESNLTGTEYNYLSNIACLYGFIIRYPKYKEKITGYDYTPNHLRYVGREYAKYLNKNNLTLEEYYE